MVFVTHDQIEAMTMADRIVVLQNGIVQHSMTPLKNNGRQTSSSRASLVLQR